MLHSIHKVNTFGGSMVRIGVLGAGALGLSAAVNIQKLMPNAKVKIIADQFDRETTTSGAGGLFRPYLSDFPGLDKTIVSQWITDSWTFYNDLATSEEAQESGQSLVTGNVFYHTPQDHQYALISKLTYDFHQVSAETLRKMKVNYTHGYTFTTVITQSHKYIVWLMNNFKKDGGTTERRTVQDLRDLCGELDLVINCCGLRANELLGDNSVYPVRGHMVEIYAPWIKHFYLTEDDIYLIPHDEKVHVGGVREKGNYSLSPDPATREKIIRRAEILLPQIKGAKFIGEWIGLRPGRDTIRFESEVLDCGTRGKLPVIHSYGHGGHGITLSWGAGVGTAKMAQCIIDPSSTRP